jgi:single-strand DNA-binding protein
MAAGDTNITLVGNLVDDPELRFTPSGQAVAKFRVASTPRYRDQQSGEWKDGESLFLSCNVWRQAAEHVAESLQRGMRVIVQGRLKQRSYETKEGEKRTVFEVEVDDVGPSLKNATAKVSKTTRSSGFGGQPPDDPWATATPAPANAASSAAAPNSGWGGSSGGASAGADEPPF